MDIAAQGDISHTAVKVFHGQRYHILIAGGHVKYLAILEDLLTFLRLHVVRLPDHGRGRYIRTGNRDPGDRLRTPDQGKTKDNKVSWSSESNQILVTGLAAHRHALLRENP